MITLYFFRFTKFFLELIESITLYVKIFHRGYDNTNLYLHQTMNFLSKKDFTSKLFSSILILMTTMDYFLSNKNFLQ